MKWINATERLPEATNGYAVQTVLRIKFEDGWQMRTTTYNQLLNTASHLLELEKLEWMDFDCSPLEEIRKDLTFMAEKADNPLTKAAFGVALTICEDHLKNPTTTPKETAPTEGKKEVNEGFTKGEWKVRGTTRGLNSYYVGTETENLAQVFTSIPEAEANARLIAAAPKLLLSLKRMIPIAETAKLFDEEKEWIKEANEILKSIKKQ